MVLESLPLEKNSSRTIHVLRFSAQRKTFKMGRGHESEVRVSDISVSRTHAIIRYQADGIFISDNQSKFGTLVLVRDNECILSRPGPDKNSPPPTYNFQVGRTLIAFTVMPLIPAQKYSTKKTQGKLASCILEQEKHESTRPLL